MVQRNHSFATHTSMLAVIASLFLFSASAAPIHSVSRPALPGIEVLHIASPAPKAPSLTMPHRVSASGVILVDLSSGQEVLSRNADQRHPMASLTKIMTALLILQHRNLQEIVTIPPTAEKILGSGLKVRTGQHFTVLSLLQGMLIASANDVAYSLAIFDRGSINAFVEQMNKRAKALGLRNTHFTNPAGLDSLEQYSTARDMAWLTMAALKEPTFRSIVRMKTGRISSLEENKFDVRNTNELLQDSPNVYGVKTGTTQNAGECLIVLFEEGGRLYLLVLLGSADRYTDSLFIMKAVHESSVPHP